MTCGVSAELAARISEECFDFLEEPVARIAGEDIPISVSPALERASIPTVDLIVEMDTRGDDVMTSVFKLPLLGETMETGRIGQWLKRPGESFTRGETIVEVETDKTTVEVPALSNGTLVEILAETGVDLKIGEPLCVIQSDAPAGVPSPSRVAATAAATPAPAKASSPGASESPQTSERAIVASARRRWRGDFAQKQGVAIVDIVGTGRRGRIEARDVLARGGAQPEGAPARALAVEARGPTPSASSAAPPPPVDFARFGPVEAASLSRLQRISGPRLHSAWVNIPHVTHFDEADVTDLEAFRKPLDQDAKADKDAPYRVSLLPFLMRRRSSR